MSLEKRINLFINFSSSFNSDTRKLLVNDKVALIPRSAGLLGKLLAKVSSSARESQQKFRYYDIFDRNTSLKVGEMQLNEESSDTILLNWISIDKNSMNKKFAQNAIDLMLKNIKSLGYKKCILECVGAENAHHLYHKIGFKDTGVLTKPEDDPAWDGLTGMSIDLSKYKGL